MKVDSQTLQDLEWDKFRLEWKALTSTPYGKRYIDSISFNITSAERDRQLRIAKAIHEFINEFQVPRLPDISYLFDLPQGYVLSTQQLWDVASFIEGAVQLKRVLGASADDELTSISRALNLPLRLSKLIRSKLSSADELRDDASPELLRIRRGLSSLREHIRRRLEEIVSKLWEQGILQERLFTLRNGRFVLPVKVERSTEVEGIIQALSGSQRTAFIEPIEVVHLNNKLVELQGQEQEEMRRILTELSADALRYTFLFKKAVQLIAVLDALHALVKFNLSKGRIAFPEFVKDDLELRGAVHPLLKVEPVPIDLLFNRKKVLLITGPNAGGKTVALKTLGLLSLIATLGLPVPAERFKLPELRGIIADISDKQDIEENLSTFSAHVQRWREILRDASRNTLVILDEPASGTSPKEGAALTIALVETLKDYNALTCFTTHFDEVKAWAMSHDYTIASFRFDLETLSPTYQLTYGVPGYSYAFEICERGGLSRRVLTLAKRLMSEMGTEMNQALRELAQLIDEYQVKLKELRGHERELKEMERKLRRLEKELMERRARAFQTAKQEAISQLEPAVKEIMAILEELKRLRREGRELKSLRKVKNKVVDLRAQVHAYGSFTDEFEPYESSAEAVTEEWNQEIQVGDRVEVLPIGVRGKVTAMRGAYAVVESDGKSFEVPIKRLRKVESVEVEERGGGWSFQGRVEEVPDELSLRRMTVAEALIELERYLERAKLYGHTRVRVIHGKGTGTLRRAVHQRLRELKEAGLVRDFHLADEHEGGLGATIVLL